VLRINKKVEYAMMVLKFLALKPHDELVTARDICKEFNTPFDSTAKVMQKLNTANILNSAKGIKGGYSLKKKLSNVTYMDLVKVIEGDQVGRVCESNNGKCENYEFCNIISPVENLNHQVFSFLNTLKLDELLQITSNGEQ
jgi:Rrf2 family protein